MNEHFPTLPLPVTFASLFAIVTLRYAVPTGIAYLVFWVMGKAAWKHRRISAKEPPRHVVVQEFAWSIVNAALFAAIGTLLLRAWQAGHTRIYSDPMQHGWIYLPLSVALFALLHDTYFYWVHRWMHLPQVFRYVHRTHHQSVHPTPWAAFSFHPVEGLILSLIIPLLVLVIPIHWAALLFLLTFMTITSIINHLGYELFPEGFAEHPFFRWWISATHHQAHHRKFRGNYGLYFNLWDRLLGTQDPDYETEYRARWMESTPTPADTADADVIIVGGGLVGGLLALRLKQTRPEWKVRILEKSSEPGGNHTWSFHLTDIPPESRAWIQPLIAREWPAYEVRFPEYTRRLEIPYCSITSEKFRAVLTARLGSSVETQANVVSLTPDSVELGNGTRLRARAVIDARGTGPASLRGAGFQNFVGLDIVTTRPHGLTSPVLMDARVEQKDGYRFFYVLPWDETRLLIEDTRYSNETLADADEYIRDIHEYAEYQGWTIQRITRFETGALPIPYQAEFFTGCGNEPQAIGMKAGFFHETTGYSLPDAVHTVETLAALREWSPKTVQAALARLRQSLMPRRRFLLLLNRMMFLAAPPAGRFRIFQRFYRFSVATIEHFYAGRLNGVDKLRLLLGRPPVPLLPALGAALSTRTTGKEHP